MPKRRLYWCIFEGSRGLELLVYEKSCIYDGTHGGQISFPGGKREEATRDFEQTALRETRGRGIPEQSVKVIRKLDPLYIPPSNFHWSSLHRLFRGA